MRSQHNLPRIIPEYTYAWFNPYFLWKSFWYPMKINIQYAPCMEYLPTFALKSPSFVGKYTSTMEHMGITIASTTNIPIYHKSMNPSVGMVSWAPTHPIWNLQGQTPERLLLVLNSNKFVLNGGYKPTTHHWAGTTLQTRSPFQQENCLQNLMFLRRGVKTVQPM